LAGLGTSCRTNSGTTSCAGSAGGSGEDGGGAGGSVKHLISTRPFVISGLEIVGGSSLNLILYCLIQRQKIE
jgi:hypothetical protein